MKIDRRTFLAGTSGLAATLTFPATGATPLVFDDGFENGVDPDLYKITAAGIGTLEAVSTRSREGGRSLHTKVVKSGVISYRQEVALKKEADASRGAPAQGSPYYWLGLSMYLPSTSLNTTQSVVLQWHTLDDHSGASPVVGIRVENHRWRLTTWRAGSLNLPGNIATDRWTDFVFRILWRNNATGSIRIWQDGVMVHDRSSVQTTWEGENAVPYLKLGRYSSSWNDNNQPDPDGSVQETWHDCIRVAFDNAATYDDVAPRGVSAAPMPPGALTVG